jgi:hypothetical protein
MARNTIIGLAGVLALLLCLLAPGAHAQAWWVSDFDRVAHERIVASPNQPTGSGVNYADQGDSDYQAASVALSGNGRRIWFVIYHRYAPTGVPKHQLWSINADGSDPQRSGFDIEPGLRQVVSTSMSVRTTRDGGSAVVDNDDELYRVGGPGATAEQLFNFQNASPFRRVSARLLADGSQALVADSWNYDLATLNMTDIAPAFSLLLNRNAFQYAVNSVLYDGFCRDGFDLARTSGIWFLACDYASSPARYALWKGSGASLAQVTLPYADTGQLFGVFASNDGSAYVVCISGSVVGDGSVSEAQCYLQREGEAPLHLGEPPTPDGDGRGEGVVALAGDASRVYYSSFNIGLCNDCLGLLQDLSSLKTTPAGGGFLAGAPLPHYASPALSDDGRVLAGATRDGAVYVLFLGEPPPTDLPRLDAIWQRYDADTDELVIRARLAPGSPLPDRIYEAAMYQGSLFYRRRPGEADPLEADVGFWGGGSSGSGRFVAVDGAQGWYEQRLNLLGRKHLLDADHQLRVVAVAEDRHRASFYDVTVNPYLDPSELALHIGIERAPEEGSSPWAESAKNPLAPRFNMLTSHRGSFGSVAPVRFRMPKPIALGGTSWSCVAPRSCSLASGSDGIDVSFELRGGESAKIVYQGELAPTASFIQLQPLAVSETAVVASASASYVESANGLGILLNGFE